MRKRILSLLLCLSLLLTLLPGVRAEGTEGETLEFTPADLSAAGPDFPGPELPLDGQPESGYLHTDLVKVIILMDEESVLQTNAGAAYNAATRSQTESLLLSQEKVLRSISRKVFAGQPLSVDYRYTWLLNGVAMSVPYGAIGEIEKLDGVRKVLLQQVYAACEDTGETAFSPAAGPDILGREAAWELGYTGKGMKIAVIDTGLDSDHPSFSSLGSDQLAENSAGEETIAAVLGSLNAHERCPELEAQQLYRSSKVAFGFNYCDNNTVIDHLDNQGGHGTHVAGVAAANREPEPRAAGVAPDAQLYIMKVFGVNGGAYTQDILAAMEDALLLDADVINLSLGAPAGFSSGDKTPQGDSLDEFYDTVAAAGTVLCVSAGNYYSSGYANRWGTDANLSRYPDDGVVGAPGTYANTLTVASAENGTVSRKCIRIGDRNLPYQDSTGYGLPGLDSLTGEYELVFVPGAGETADYAGLDVKGKIVLVQRGGISFLEKHRAAEAAGAAGMLVYNNADGEFVMDMSGTDCTTPAAALTRADGKILRTALEEEMVVLLSFPSEPVDLPSPDAFQMSDFSAKGPAPDLKLTPDITAPGGNIYSATDGGGYGLMSGTSMASPAMAGMAALVLQYIRQEHPTAADPLAAVRNLLGSTALPVQEGTLPYSPRKQGAGMANLFRALTCECCLEVEGMDFPRAELGDDPDKTGNYMFDFRVNNDSDTDAYFAFHVSVMTEGTTRHENQVFLSGTSVALDARTRTESQGMILRYDVDDSGTLDSRDARRIWEAARGLGGKDWELTDFRYDTDEDESVTKQDVQTMLEALVGNSSGETLNQTLLKVPAGQSARVEVAVSLTDQGKNYLNANFPNGGYVEGYARLQALHGGGADLSLPYLGFYGDWAQAPVLDTGSYWDLLNAPEGEVVGNQSVHLLLSEYEGNQKGIYPGMNPYITQEPFDTGHICLSPNEDGNLDSLSDIRLSLLRNASALSLRIVHGNTGEILWSAQERNLSKSVYRESAGQVMPWSWDREGTGDAFDFRTLENGTQVILEAEALGVAENAKSELWSVPITIDLEAPQLLQAVRFAEEESGKTTLQLRFRENLAAAAVILTDGGGKRIVTAEGLDAPDTEDKDGRIYTKSLDITGLTGKIHVILADYGANRQAYAINLGGEGKTYGKFTGFQRNFTTGENSWVSFDRDVQKNEISVYPAEETAIAAAEYAEGWLYAQREDGTMRRIPGEELLRDLPVTGMKEAGSLERVYLDLTWDRNRQQFYGLYQDKEAGLTQIYAIRQNPGKNDAARAETQWQEEPVLTLEGLTGFCLASDGRGTLYLLGTLPGSREAVLFTAVEDPAAGGLECQQTGALALTMRNPQSMTFDEESGTLIWARFDLEMGKPQCQLVEIFPKSAPEQTVLKTRILGELSGQVLGLMIPEENR